MAYACGVSRFDAYGDLLDEPHPLQAIEFSLRAMFIELSTIDEVEDKVRNTVFSGATSAGLFR